MKKIISILTISLLVISISCKNNLFHEAVENQEDAENNPDTGQEVTQTIPSVTNTTPANGATDVSLNTLIIVEFSKEMDANTITTETLTISTGGTNVEGSILYTGTSAIFTPAANLSPSSIYQGKVTVAAKSKNGIALNDEYIWIFSTGTTSDSTAPSVLTTNPTDQATGVSLNTSISANFSEAVDPSTVTNTTFTLKAGTNAVSGTVSYTGTTATFTPDANLAANTLFITTITTGIKDSAGNALASEYTWSFTTNSALDTIAPTVSSTDPADTAIDVSVDTTITVTFDEAMDASTISATNFTLNDGNNDVTVTVSSTSSTTFVFTPASALANNTTYTATITTGAKDSAGNGLASDFTWSFTTTDTAGSVSFNMVNVPGKSFFTGANDGGSATVSNAYLIGETEVTYELWYTVYDWAVNGTGVATGEGLYTFANPGVQGDSGGGTDQHPVTTINWRDAMVWMNALPSTIMPRMGHHWPVCTIRTSVIQRHCEPARILRQ